MLRNLFVIVVFVLDFLIGAWLLWHTEMVVDFCMGAIRGIYERQAEEIESEYERP